MTFARQSTFWDYAEAQGPGLCWPAPVSGHPKRSRRARPECWTEAGRRVAPEIALPVVCSHEDVDLLPPTGGAFGDSPMPMTMPERGDPGSGVSGQADALRRRKALRGSMSHHAGKAAEAAVLRHYEGLGRPVVAERWRCPYGEIDLVAQDGAEIVFVEVKQGPSHDAALAHLTPRQIERIVAAASVYLGGLPLGQATPVRFDVATVDGMGRIDIREAAFC